jgi:hypothetical protein
MVYGEARPTPCPEIECLAEIIKKEIQTIGRKSLASKTVNATV